MKFLKCEIKPGGSSFYYMTMAGGGDMYGRCEYLEINPPHRMTYLQQFCDKNEKITRHPMAPLWPESMLTTVEFTEEGPSQTRITITWEPHGKTTPEELATFIHARGGMRMSWTGSLDKLEEGLKTLHPHAL